MADREERLAYARTLIITHPKWGKDRVNREVKTYYGTGLRRIDVARLKDTTLIGRPRARTGRKPIEKLVREAILLPEVAIRRVITIGFDEAYHRLRAAGFIDMEIRHIFSAGNVPELFNTAPFNAMIHQRRHWVMERIKKGWTKGQLLDAIKRYYTKPERSPFDFLRREYKPPLRVDFVKYRAAARKRAMAKTRTLYATARR